MSGSDFCETSLLQVKIDKHDEVGFRLRLLVYLTAPRFPVACFSNVTKDDIMTIFDRNHKNFREFMLPVIIFL